MIYTITFNPSLDYVMKVDNFRKGEVNRAELTRLFPGGKGINVSIVLANMGMESRALGFKAGFTGDQIERMLIAYGCRAQLIALPDGGISRINVKLQSDGETDLNAAGPHISNSALEQLMEKLDTLESQDILVISGSIPASLPEDVYQKIMERLSGKNIPIVVDATNNLLRNVLAYHPFLIKPNLSELCELVGRKLESIDDIITQAAKLHDAGAQNVLVSMGGDGALLYTADDKVYHSPAPQGEVRNTVGSGDAMVAGFLTGWIRSNGDCEKAFALSLAAGSASAFCDGLATGADIQRIMNTDFYKNTLAK